jgi:hypothetical protein
MTSMLSDPVALNILIEARIEQLSGRRLRRLAPIAPPSGGSGARFTTRLARSRARRRCVRSSGSEAPKSLQSGASQGRAAPG